MTTLVGKKAPDFNCAAVLPNGTTEESFSFSVATKDKYAIVFFYPFDFTFVCPTELVALDHRIEALKERKVEVIAVSIDSEHTHRAWRETALADGGIGRVKFTLAADVKHEICQAYGVQSEDGPAYRGAFIIDKEGTVRSALVNDLPLGRNIDELIRIIDALQFFEVNGDVCPAGWTKGDAGMSATPEGVATYLGGNAEKL